MREKEDLRICKTKTKLAAALLLLMKTTPIGKLKISQLCDEAHISRATFYNNFDDVQDVLDDYLVRLGKNVVGAVKQKMTGHNDFASAYGFFLTEIHRTILDESTKLSDVIHCLRDEKVFASVHKFVYDCLASLADSFIETDRRVPIDIEKDYLAGAFCGLLPYIEENAQLVAEKQLTQVVYQISYLDFRKTYAEKAPVVLPPIGDKQ